MDNDVVKSKVDWDYISQIEAKKEYVVVVVVLVVLVVLVGGVDQFEG
jgi:preprotein translocase subunit SecE